MLPESRKYPGKLPESRKVFRITSTESREVSRILPRSRKYPGILPESIEVSRNTY